MQSIRALEGQPPYRSPPGRISSHSGGSAPRRRFGTAGNFPPPGKIPGPKASGPWRRSVFPRDRAGAGTARRLPLGWVVRVSRQLRGLTHEDPMRLATTLLVSAFAATLHAGTAPAPLSVASARVSLDGTSSLHAYTASTTQVRVSGIDIAGMPTGDLLEYVLQPGALTGFEVVIPAASLSSPKDGIDKNMHKALKVAEHPDIRFRLRALEPSDGGYRAVGFLTIAGVEKEVVLNLQVQRKGSTLAVTGGTDLVMTDFGVKPPKAMLGMIRTDPKVRISIELVLAASLT
jgi:polyisoprenoid-binding protein YceI